MCVSVCYPSYPTCWERKLPISAWVVLGHVEISSAQLQLYPPFGSGSWVAAVPNGNRLFGEAAGRRLGLLENVSIMSWESNYACNRVKSCPSMLRKLKVRECARWDCPYTRDVQARDHGFEERPDALSKLNLEPKNCPLTCAIQVENLLHCPKRRS